MTDYVVLLRGINVGGNNIVPMASLQRSLEDAGFSNVVTYIASGNVLLESDKNPAQIKSEIEEILPENFKLNSDLIKVLVLNEKQLREVICKRPKSFGDTPEKYHSDAIFLIDVDMKEALKVFKPNEEVDKIWEGDGVIYSQRLSAMSTQSRLSRIIGTPAYRSMTIRNWNTTTKLLKMLEERKEK